MKSKSGFSLSEDLSQLKILRKTVLKKVAKRYSKSSSEIFGFITFTDKFFRKYKK